MGKLRHPFICNLNYAFQDSSFYCLVLDLVDCGDLRHHLDRYTFTEGTVRHWIAELSCAVEYLHEHNILHRDIKPENILMNSRGHVCLADFNIARELTCKRPVLGGVSGTFNYLAPEIQRGFAYSELVDWWALGVVFYESVYKRIPFRVRHRPDIINAFAEGLTFPETVPPVSNTCQTAISKFLENFPPERVQTCNQVFELEFFRGFDRKALEAAPYIMGSVEGSSYKTSLAKCTTTSSTNKNSMNTSLTAVDSQYLDQSSLEIEIENNTSFFVDTHPNSTNPRHIDDISGLPVPLLYEIEYHPEVKPDLLSMDESTESVSTREEMKCEYQKWYAKQIQHKIDKQRRKKELQARKDRQKRNLSPQEHKESLEPEIAGLAKEQKDVKIQAQFGGKDKGQKKVEKKGENNIGVRKILGYQALPSSHSKHQQLKKPVKQEGEVEKEHKQVKSSCKKNIEKELNTQLKLLNKNEQQNELKSVNVLSKFQLRKESFKNFKANISTALSKLGIGQIVTGPNPMGNKNPEPKGDKKQLEKEPVHCDHQENRVHQRILQPANVVDIEEAAGASHNKKCSINKEIKRNKKDMEGLNKSDNQINVLSASIADNKLSARRPKPDNTHNTRRKRNSLYWIRDSFIGTSRQNDPKTSRIDVTSTTSLPLANENSLENIDAPKRKIITNVSPICNVSLIPYQLRYFTHYDTVIKEERSKGKRFDDKSIEYFLQRDKPDNKLPSCGHCEEAIKKVLPQNLKNKLEIQNLFKDFNFQDLRQCECRSPHCSLSHEVYNIEVRAASVMKAWTQIARSALEKSQEISQTENDSDSEEYIALYDSNKSFEENKTSGEDLAFITLPVQSETSDGSEHFSCTRRSSISTSTTSKSTKQPYSTILTPAETSLDLRLENATEKSGTALPFGLLGLEKEGCVFGDLPCSVGGKGTAVLILKELLSENKHKNAITRKIQENKGVPYANDISFIESLPAYELRKTYTELIGLPMGVLGNGHRGRIVLS